MKNFKPHKTKREKLERKIAYAKLRSIGLCVNASRLIRDWTDNKIDLVCKEWKENCK